MPQESVKDVLARNHELLPIIPETQSLSDYELAIAQTSKDAVSTEESLLTLSQQSAQSDEAIPLGDHVRLHPLNLPARLAFNAVYTSLNVRGRHSHHLNFIKSTGAKQLGTDAVHSSDSEGSNLAAVSVHDGYYRLNLTCPPADMQLGWILGSGHYRDRARTKIVNRGVDLYLTITGTQHGVRGRHVQIFYSPHGILMLKPSRKTFVLMNETTVGPADEMTISGSCSLSIGVLQYRLELIQQDSQSYRARLNELMVNVYQNWTGSPGINPTSPTAMTPEVQGYCFYGPHAQGNSSVVLPCYHRKDGIVKACKRMGRKQSHSAQIAREITTLRRLVREGPHVNICKLIDVFDGSGTESLSMFDEVYLIFDEFIPTNLYDYGINEYRQTRFDISLYRQGLDAINFVHSCEIVHCDIKPQNFLVRQRQSGPTLILNDFGSAIDMTTSPPKEVLEDHEKGTVAWQPPELLSQKFDKVWKVPGSWSYKSDVFSYGAVGYWFLILPTASDRTLPQRIIDPATHELWIANMSKSREIDQFISRVLPSMLNPSVANRWDISQVLREKVHSEVQVC